MLIDQIKLKLIVLASCRNECIMIYSKTSSFRMLARILQSNWPQNQYPLVFFVLVFFLDHKEVLMASLLQKS